MMDKDTIKRLNRIIDDSLGTKIPMKYVKTFIVTDEIGDEMLMTPDEFCDLLDELDDDIFPLEVTYILNYHALRNDIKKLTDIILKE